MEARSDAIRKLTQSELPNLLEENRRVHQLLTEGVDVEYYANDGVLTAGKVLLLDFDRPENNDWLAVQQLVVISGQHQRRPDVALFVNGLPLAVIELKAPGSAGANLWGRSTNCRPTNSRLPRCSKPMPCWSHPTASRRGWDRCRPIWNASCRRTTDGKSVLPKGQPELPTLIEGVFAPRRFWICCAGSPPLARPEAAGQDHCGLPPVPRGQPRRRFHHPCSRFEP